MKHAIEQRSCVSMHHSGVYKYAIILGPSEQEKKKKKF